jgi:single-strand DNA-binding protein
MNRIDLIGHLGKDPEMITTTDGMGVTKFSMAVNRISKGERVTDWFQVVAFSKLAETCAQYLHKGSKIFATGMLVQRNYTDKEGRDRVAIEVQLNQMEMLDSKGAD